MPLRYADASHACSEAVEEVFQELPRVVRFCFAPVVDAALTPTVSEPILIRTLAASVRLVEAFEAVAKGAAHSPLLAAGAPFVRRSLVGLSVFGVRMSMW